MKITKRTQPVFELVNPSSYTIVVAYDQYEDTFTVFDRDAGQVENLSREEMMDQYELSNAQLELIQAILLG